MREHVLVTGGFGFIGSHVVRALVQQGFVPFVIDRGPAGNAAEEILTRAELDRVECIAPAVSGADELAFLIREHRIQVLVHLASPLAVALEEAPGDVVDEMILPHVAVLDAARTTRLRRVVWGSSVGVYGLASQYDSGPLPASALHAPINVYGAGKSFLESLSAAYKETYALSTVGLRFPLVYGPGRKRGGGQFTVSMIRAALGRVPFVVDNADELYDWLYVSDAADSVVCALNAVGPFDTAINICGDVASRRAAANMLNQLLGSDLECASGAIGLAAGGDPEPARVQLGFEANVRLSEGLALTTDQMRNALEDHYDRE